MKIGIIGNGFVGKATSSLACDEVELLSYDINPDLCIPRNCTLEMITKCDLIFISVPTPMMKDGSCYLNILESVVSDLTKIKPIDEMMVVIRSTVPPGTADRLNCYFMPEFLTEKNYLEDFKNCDEWIFGLKGSDKDDKFKKNINELFTLAKFYNSIKSNKCRFLYNREAEMVKLFRNTFLAAKVSFCNEIYDYCQSANISYDNMIEVACNDSRIGHSHSKVPGHDGSRGFGGTCFPKDIANLLNLIEKQGLKSYVLKSVVNRNREQDRPEKDWENNLGRSVVENE